MPAQGRRLAPIQSTAPGRESPAPRCSTETTSGRRGSTEAVTNARQHSGMAAPLRDAAGPPPAPPRGALPPAPPPGSPRRRRNTSPVAVDEAPLNDLAPAGPRRSPAGSPDRKLALVAEVSPVDDALGDVRVARAAKPGLALVPELEPTAEAWGDLVAGAVAPPAPGLAPVAEVSPVADALGVVERPRARRPATLPLVAEVSPVDEALGGAARAAPAPRRPSLDLVPEVSPVDDALGDVRVARAAKPGLALVPELEPTAEAWGDVAPGPARAPRGGRLSLVPEEPPEAPAPAPAPARRRSNCLLDCLRRRRREASP